MGLRGLCENKWFIFKDRLLGKGKHGCVYEACFEVKKNFHRYAVKVTDEKEGLNEIVKAYSLQSYSFFPRVYDAWICEGKVFLVMEKINGLTFRQYKQTLVKRYGWKKAWRKMYFLWIRADRLREQLRKDGLIYTDVHSDNIMYANGRVYFVDMGAVDSLNKEEGKGFPT